MVKIGLVYAEDGKDLKSTFLRELNKMDNRIKLINIRFLKHMLERSNYCWNYDTLIMLVTKKVSDYSNSFGRNLEKYARKNNVILINIDDNRIRYRKKKDFMELYINSTDVINNYNKMEDFVSCINSYLVESKLDKRIKLQDENQKKPEIILLGMILLFAFLILFFIKSCPKTSRMISGALTIAVSIFIGIYTGFKVYYNKNEYISFYKKLDDYLIKPEHKNLIYDEIENTIKENLDKMTLDYEKNNSSNFKAEMDSDELLHLKKENKELKKALVNNDKTNKKNLNILSSSSYSPLGHLQFNMGQMWEYHKMGIKQSKIAFNVAIAFAFLGMPLGTDSLAFFGIRY